MKKRKQILSLLIIFMLFLTGCSFFTDNKMSTIEKIKKTGYLVLATEPGFQPMEYYEGNKVVGIDIDIANEIAKELGVKLYTPLELEFNSLIPALSIGKADIVMAGMSITEERREQVDFSNVYFSTHQVIVSREDNLILTEEELDGKIVGAQLGTTGDFYIEELNVEAKLFDKFNQCIEALKNGSIDAVVMDIAPAKGFLEKNKNLQMSESLFEDEYGIAINKGDEDFLKEINTIIKNLQDSGKIEEIRNKHMN